MLMKIYNQAFFANGILDFPCCVGLEIFFMQPKSIERGGEGPLQ